MNALTAAEMQACDRITQEKFGLSSRQLMHNASTAVANFALDRFPATRHVTVLCGRGNNGGDGLVTANVLAKKGCHVTAVLLGAPDGLKGDAADAWRLFTSGMSGSDNQGPLQTAVTITAASQLSEHTNLLKADLIIDAIVGIGFKPPLRDLPLAALEWLHAAQAVSSCPGGRSPLRVGCRLD